MITYFVEGEKDKNFIEYLLKEILEINGSLYTIFSVGGKGRENFQIAD